MRVLLAFDKFKDALSADDACAIAAGTLREIHGDWEFDRCPLTDGGEGFARILTRAADGTLRAFPVTGPRGDRVVASIGFVALQKIPAAARTRLALPPLPDDATIAIVEMASASGLALLSPALRDPWETSTFGTGELIRAAAQQGVAAILLGVGGSATNDLGLGALAALGLEFCSPTGAKIEPPVPARWKNIAHLASAVTPTLPPIRIACDVTNSLLGPHGCATSFGRQKGLAPADIPRMENESARLALALCTYAGRSDSLMDLPGAGAAGGIAFGLMVAANASLLSGFDLVAEWLDLDRRIAAAEVVLTGEGRFDGSSLRGKGPGAVVTRARSQGRTVHVFAGAIADAMTGDPSLHAVTPPDLPLEKALRATPELLRTAIRKEFRRRH